MLLGSSLKFFAELFSKKREEKSYIAGDEAAEAAGLFSDAVEPFEVMVYEEGGGAVFFAADNVKRAADTHEDAFTELMEVIINKLFLLGHTEGNQADIGLKPCNLVKHSFFIVCIAVLGTCYDEVRIFGFSCFNELLVNVGAGAEEEYGLTLSVRLLQEEGAYIDAGDSFFYWMLIFFARHNHGDAVGHEACLAVGQEAGDIAVILTVHKDFGVSGNGKGLDIICETVLQ